MQKIIDFVPLLSMIQEHISSRYAAALSDSSKLPQLRSYIDKYLLDTGYVVEGLTQTELSNKLYSEMAEYSILTKYLGRDNIEEININAWNDIAITYTSGRTIKAKEHFYSPSHAVDIVITFLQRMCIRNLTVQGIIRLGLTTPQRLTALLMLQPSVCTEQDTDLQNGEQVQRAEHYLTKMMQQLSQQT